MDAGEDDGGEDDGGDGGDDDGGVCRFFFLYMFLCMINYLMAICPGKLRWCSPPLSLFFLSLTSSRGVF